MNNKLKQLAVALPFALLSTTVSANWSTTITAASDYTFNGVTQTDSDPAIQASLDYAFDSGVYAGAWASNVDFGDDTDFELDAYLGKYVQLTDKVSADYGIAYYTYQGNNSDGNYAEAYTKFGYASEYGQTELNFWYSWDYFGTGAGHVISMIAHTFEIAPNHAIRASFDISNSLDGEKWAWDVNQKKSYKHYRLAYQTSYEGFGIEIAAEDTSLDYDYADERIVLAISRTFDL
ncbi:TorF family putative porin [Pseudoalteromonas agarivorans]|uniref:TorF family putative porin n=1 Tax=Pseudoalteromonas agarivorans TaxID=176102 RepID=UPI0023596292|nr:TorF family putative porin [Pseudoalteromonas agarivorans]MDC9523222.1 TorF family putative porin [Pseudoalteromonas sp. Angola-31]MDI3243561.1 TorF family putative porin [Pseudoalteromonas agarivorans]